MSASSKTRERILAGAARTFGRLGYAATRVEDILLDAKVSRPTFYKFFKSKDGVFGALSDRHHAEVFDRLVAATAGADGPAEILDRTVEAFLQWRAELGPMGRVLDTEARVPGSQLQAPRQRLLEAVVERIQLELKNAGRSTADPLLLYALIAAAENVADSFLSERRRGPQELERRRAVLSRLVRSALAEPGDAVPTLPRPPAVGRPRSRKSASAARAGLRADRSKAAS